mgnify:CR=1 FL=1
MSDLIKDAYKWIDDGACDVYNEPGEAMADFATAAMKAERERIATELERITNGSSCEVNSLIAELRGGK